MQGEAGQRLSELRREVDTSEHPSFAALRDYLRLVRSRVIVMASC